MPEGPEVVSIVQYIKSNFLNKKIKSIKIISGRYSKSKPINYNLIKPKHMYTIKKIDSKGKFIWFELQESKTLKTIYMINTLGLTGDWNLTKSKSSRLEFNFKILKFKLYFDDQRNFGEIRFYDTYDYIEAKIDKLGPDILKSNISVQQMHNILNQDKLSNKNIVNVLTDQTILSGIGNYLVAEILYDSKVNPQHKMKDLNSTIKKRLARSIRKIAKYAYYSTITQYTKKYINYIPSIKPGSNFEFEFKVYRQKFDPKGNPVKKYNKKDRTIYWVPKIQN